MIAMHATAASNPQQLRWVIARGALPPAGTVRQAPGRLGILLDDGVIEELVVRNAFGKGEVLITLSAGKAWRDLGGEIRNALSDALQDSAGWRVDSPAGKDAQLAEIASELLAGHIGALAQSHGGSIELVSVRGHNITVRMSGACDGCPASGSTLHDKLQRELRRRVSDQVTVSSESHSAPLSFTKKLLSLVPPSRANVGSRRGVHDQHVDLGPTRDIGRHRSQ
jgi:NFU1 iron-sulfur cluster scaffold homolog, mitochondrial